MARPILPWRSPYLALPQEDSAVWIRRLPWYDTPVKATFNSPDAFGIDVTYYNDPPVTFNTVVPILAVHSWKFQFKADEDTFRSRQPS